jgi:hypothetical protein
MLKTFPCAVEPPPDDLLPHAASENTIARARSSETNFFMFQFLLKNFCPSFLL